MFYLAAMEDYQKALVAYFGQLIVRIQSTSSFSIAFIFSLTSFMLLVPDWATGHLNFVMPKCSVAIERLLQIEGSVKSQCQ